MTMDHEGALARFYNDRPEALSDNDLAAIVDKCREERARWAAKREAKAAKAITMVDVGGVGDE